MIENLESFGQSINSLLRYYNKPEDDLIKEAWFRGCNEALTDNEFAECCYQCVKQYRFLPSIDEFVALVHGDRKSITELKCSETWQRVQELISQGAERDTRAKFIESLSVEHRQALMTLGGLHGIGMTKESQLAWKYKEFVDLVHTYNQAQQLEERRATSLNGLTPISLSIAKEF
ncbi:MAG: hypothetical protein F6K14_26810 [Symploca sp. SIO2C1]|nr:hypothetical protein [Symploca sp. SIO2C1]